MAKIVGVHGIAQQLKGPEVLAADWGPALRDGARLSGLTLAEEDLRCAFYGHVFRAPGATRATSEHFVPADLTADEVELLLALWREGARAEPQRVVAPEADVRGTPELAQRALRALARSKFLVDLATSAFIGALKQVRRYFREPEVRAAAKQSVDDVVTADTRVLVGHSLGSVVAYEALHAFGHTERWANVRTFVTMGSPLGIPNLIFDQLSPAPKDGRGVWPPHTERWTNISDDGDVVALVKELGPLFGGALVDVRVSNEARAHDASPYLTARETGRAIADGLA